MDLQGRAAVVTGGGRGIGRDFSLAMAQAGAKVVVNDLGASTDGGDIEGTPAQEVVATVYGPRQLQIQMGYSGPQQPV